MSAGSEEAAWPADADAATTGSTSRFVKIIAIAAVKANGKFDMVDVQIHPWSPGSRVRAPRRNRHGWTGAVSSQRPRAGAGAGKVRHGDSDWMTAATTHGQETMSNYSQNNSQNRDDGIPIIIPLDNLKIRPRN